MARKLTARIIDAEPVPAKGGRTLWDSEIRGLGVRLHAGGAKSFFLNYRFGGIERRKTIGRYGEWSVEGRTGRGPRAPPFRSTRGMILRRDKRQRREAPTIQDLIDRYVRDHLPTAGEARARAEKAQLAEIRRASRLANEGCGCACRRRAGHA